MKLMNNNLSKAKEMLLVLKWPKVNAVSISSSENNAWFKLPDKHVHLFYKPLRANERGLYYLCRNKTVEICMKCNKEISAKRICFVYPRFPQDTKFFHFYCFRSHDFLKTIEFVESRM